MADVSRCAHCGGELLPGQRVCAVCGTPVAASPPPGPFASLTRSAIDTPSAMSSADERFAPGTVLGQRYRISARLGRGGMGEVYRAYDLTLQQDVALKFLPEGFATTPQARERLRQEVRLARQVSHPNVCRVYDIGDAAGSSFLSMEYVDGEDLASLLRRIGRLPADKALDIARQLCAGLSAAHEKQVLHRDLKPANIMIDGRGEVLITDFGLAAVAGTVPAPRAREGTRAYMSPEQLAGQEVTARSDIYALGLVLYEVFTGKRAFRSDSDQELARLQRDSTPASMTSVAKDIDPAVERIILRCLAHDPKQRPASSKLVALALPGGDPLAAAIAAGETPSPELVARAGETQGWHPAIAATLLAAIIVALIITTAWQPRSVWASTPFDNSPEALATLARDHVGRLGYETRAVDSAYGFESSGSYFAYAGKHYSTDQIWAQIAAARPAPVTFWYRQAGIPLDPGADRERVTPNAPPMDHAGTLRMFTDLEGRLLSFEIMPPEHEVVSGPPPAIDWSPLFAAAALDSTKFQAATPEWTPLMAFDSRAAWTGVWPGAPEVPIRIEAAAWHGKAVSFRIVEPWTTPARDQTAPSEWEFLIIAIVLLAAITLLVARRNLYRKRADRAGALRLAVAVFALDAIQDLLVMSHVADAGELLRLFNFVGIDLAQAAMVAVLYLALEPYVRQRCPRLLVSWTRLLQGGFRDPLVGMHVLIGLLVGFGVIGAFRLETWLRLGAGHPPAAPFVLEGILGARVLIGMILSAIFGEVQLAMGLLFLFFVLRVILRRDWLAATAWVIVYAGLLVIPISAANAAGAVALVGMLIAMSVVLVRFGFLAMLAGFVVGGLTQGVSLMTLDPSRWYFGYSLTTLLVIAAIATYAFRISLGGQPLFADEAPARPAV